MSHEIIGNPEPETPEERFAKLSDEDREHLVDVVRFLEEERANERMRVARDVEEYMRTNALRLISMGELIDFIKDLK